MSLFNRLMLGENLTCDNYGSEYSHLVNVEYAVGETFKSGEGPIVLRSITKKQVLFAKKTEQGTQKYVMKFRKKKGSRSRGRGARGGGRQVNDR